MSLYQELMRHLINQLIIFEYILIYNCRHSIKTKIIFFDEKFLKFSEGLQSKVNKLLEEGKLITKEWKDNNSVSLINDCINIENCIKNLNKVNKKLKILIRKI